MAIARITWHDTLLMPEDGKRYEAIDGEMYVTPAPSRRHQRISLNLARAMCSVLEDQGHGRVYAAPIGVELPRTDEGIQPDIVFVSRNQSHILVEEGIRGMPHLVVEILSPGTAIRDRTVSCTNVMASCSTGSSILTPDRWRSGTSHRARTP